MANQPPSPDFMQDLVRCLDTSGELARIVASLKSLPTQTSSSRFRPNDSFSSHSSTSDQSAQQLHLRPAVNVAQVTDVSPQLGRFIMEEPISFRKLLKSAIFQLAKSLGVEGLQQNQVVAIPSITGLVPFYEHEVTGYGWLGGLRDSPKLHSLERTVLVALSEKVKYVSCATYKCLEVACGWRGENSLYVKLFSPAQGRGARMQEQCLDCDGPLEEQYSRRDVSERVAALLRVGRCTVAAIFRQEEAAALQLGAEISVVFTLVHERDGASRRALLEVWGVEPLLPVLHRQVAVSGSVQLPSSLATLYHSLAASPWSFVLALGIQLASPEVPTYSLITLRLALLLSLASSGAERLHLLASGRDLVLAHRLLRAAQQLSPCPALYSQHSSLRGSVDRDSTGAACVQAGLLQRAQGGVLFLGDLATLKPAVRQQLLRTVETNKVCSPSLPHSPGMEQPLTCALWGLAEGSPTSTRTTTQGFSDVFGLVLQTDISDTEVLQHYLGESSAASSLPSVPPSDLVSFMGQARHFPVSLSPTCLSTLKNYFVASRRHRQGCEMAQSALKTLLCLAKCHAKLALRSMAGEVDAVFACFILEQNLMLQTGYSPIGLRPATQAVIGSLEEFLEDNDSRMLQFKARLRKFLSEESDGEEGMELEE